MNKKLIVGLFLLFFSIKTVFCFEEEPLRKKPKIGKEEVSVTKLEDSQKRKREIFDEKTKAKRLCIKNLSVFGQEDVFGMREVIDHFIKQYQ